MKIEPAAAPAEGSLLRHPALPYVAPFAVFLAFLSADRFLPFSAETNYAIRFVVSIFGSFNQFPMATISVPEMKSQITVPPEFF